MTKLKTNILVIGSGLSGAIAALTAAEENKKVILITKCDDLLSGNTRWAQGGIAHPGADDVPTDFKEDIISAGCHHNDSAAVEQLNQEGSKLIEKLLLKKFNISFATDNNNNLLFTTEAAHSTKRILHCQDQTGLTIHKTILTKLKQHPGITTYTNHTAIDLLTSSHHSNVSIDVYQNPFCFGAVLLHNTNHDIIQVHADNTILATGGLGQIYLHSTNPEESKGDGIAMAWRAGARCFNLQYIQFHPTAFFHESGRFLISEAVRGEGGRLYDVNGVEFMKNIHLDSSLAPRDIVARAIHQTLITTNHPCVYLDISHKEATWIKGRFPTIYKHCFKHGIDITTKPIPVVPAAHYSCGGIGADLKGRTSLHRLYAIGEVSCTGVHGANRLASTSLLECLVWGYISGKNAALNTGNQDYPPTNDWIQENEAIDPALIAQDWLIIKNTMWNSVGLVRTRERLHQAHHILRNLQYDIEQFYQKAELTPEIVGLRNGVQTALAITSAALSDRTSKGCHYIT